MVQSCVKRFFRIFFSRAMAAIPVETSHNDHIHSFIHISVCVHVCARNSPLPNRQMEEKLNSFIESETEGRKSSPSRNHTMFDRCSFRHTISKCYHKFIQYYEYNINNNNNNKMLYVCLCVCGCMLCSLFANDGTNFLFTAK